MQAESTKAARPMQAMAEVTVADPQGLIDRVSRHFIDHDAEITPLDGGFSATFFFGRIAMQVRPDMVVMSVEASDEAALARVKSVAASHLIQFVQGERPRFAWTGDGVGITKFPNLHEMRVERVVDVTPHMRRITMSGPGLERYISGGQHFKLFVPPEGISTPEWPVPSEDGTMVWPADDKRPQVRTYTVRSVDLEAGTFDADFVLHGDHSVGSRWANRARPGDIVGIRGPVGRAVPEADWYLLVGDETALPVIARTLESLPENAKGVALIEIMDESERQPINTKSQVEIRWLLRNGEEPGTTSLLVGAVHDVQFPTDGSRIHAMAGVEYTTFKAIRRYWRDELKLNKKDVMPVSYWRRGVAEGEVVPDNEKD